MNDRKKQEANIRKAVELARLMWKEEQFNFLGGEPTGAHWNYRYETSEDIIAEILGLTTEESIVDYTENTYNKKAHEIYFKYIICHPDFYNFNEQPPSYTLVFAIESTLKELEYTTENTIKDFIRWDMRRDTGYEAYYNHDAQTVNEIFDMYKRAKEKQ